VAAEQKARGFKDTKSSQHKTVDADHGRIETRAYTVVEDVKWLRAPSVVRVEIRIF
jgi:hypothetical protein